MRRADRTGALRASALLGLLVAASTAFAGGPLFVVPSAGTLKPARWEGTVKFYLDRGNLGAIDNARATEVVAHALQQWSSVPTSSFRATIAGQLPVDITGANAGTVIGAPNGGGVQVIFDSDASVLTDFIGVGPGVLGIATPEMLAAEGSTRIVEGWVILRGEEDFEPYREWFPDMPYVPGEPTSGVATHEFGHVINLAHSQTNGYYARNRANPDLGLPEGPDQAGPDQCGKVAPHPTAADVETMYPLINPFPFSSGYNSPQMSTVNVADDRSSLSALYPSTGYAAQTGTVRGRVVAKDGSSPLTGVNVIARRIDSGNPFDAMSRISGDLTQGLLGPDGSFVMTGFVPGAQYVLYVDQIAEGGFSTPKAILNGPEEYWNATESGDANVDDACESTPLTLAAGESRQLQIALNGIPRAPTFTHLPYVLVSTVSDRGDQLAGAYGNFRAPFWLWNKQGGVRYLGGEGFLAALSGNGRVVGATIGVDVETEFGPVVQQRAALWTKEKGWTSIAPNYAGCDIFQTTPYDLSHDGSTAVGLAFTDCRNAYGFVWNARTGMRLLPKVSEGQTCDDGMGGTYECEGAARANSVSAAGTVVGGWEEIPEAFGFRVGSLWKGKEQMLLRDPQGDNFFGGWVGEVNGVNADGTIAVGGQQGPQSDQAYRWSATEGVVSLGRVPGVFCFLDWWTGEEICTNRETTALNVANDGSVITGQSFGEAVIYTPKLGWMVLAEFLDRQGVLEASRWLLLGATVSGDGKVIAGTGLPLAADYFHGFRVEFDQVYVCHGRGRTAKTLRVGFPTAMDLHLGHGDAVGLCEGDRPL